MIVKLKPSEYPNYTIIDDPIYGLYVKENFHLWTQIHPAEEQEHPYMVSDKGFHDLEDIPEHYVIDKSDDVFGEFEIRSLPVGWRLPKIPTESRFDWWPIPGHPKYLIRADGLKIRNIRDGARRAKTKARSGYFVLYTGGVPYQWHERDLGNEAQIKHFLETGQLHPDLLKGETIDAFG
jgi:hypothetical protein